MNFGLNRYVTFLLGVENCLNDGKLGNCLYSRLIAVSMHVIIYRPRILDSTSNHLTRSKKRVPLAQALQRCCNSDVTPFVPASFDLKVHRLRYLLGKATPKRHLDTEARARPNH